MVSVLFDRKEASSSPEGKGVKWGADGTWNSSGKYFRPNILHILLFINDLPLHVSSQEDLYDDGTLAASAHFNNSLELELSLNISANEIRHWADSNKLPINESKAEVLMTTRKYLASNINNALVVHSNLLSATRKLRSFPTRNCKSDCEMRVIYTKSGNYNSLNVLTETIRRKIICNIFDEHQPVI